MHLYIRDTERVDDWPLQANVFSWDECVDLHLLLLTFRGCPDLRSQHDAHRPRAKWGDPADVVVALVDEGEMRQTEAGGSTSLRSLRTRLVGVVSFDH
jgi:hypothetical protein